MAVSADVLGWVLTGLTVALLATGLALWRLAGRAGARGGVGLVAVLAAVVVAALWPPVGWCVYGLLAGGDYSISENRLSAEYVDQKKICYEEAVKNYRILHQVSFMFDYNLIVNKN